MEVWEVASSLGEATGDLEEWQSEYSRLEQEMLGDDLPTSPQSGLKYGNDVLAQRIAHAKGEGPAPEARPMSNLEVSRLARHLGGN